MILDDSLTLEFEGKTYYEFDIICAINQVYGGSYQSMLRIYGAHNIQISTNKVLQRIRDKLIWPAIRRLHNENVLRVVECYMREYKRLHPDFSWLPVPVGLAMDGRWQKRYGWNSLDGHGLGHIYFPDEEDHDNAVMEEGI